jgi:hypothetical protein
MNRILAFLVGLSSLAGLAGATELLVNGDFEQPLAVGWHDTIYNAAGDGYFERTDTLGQPTLGYAVRVHKYLASFACLDQTVNVSNASLTFGFDGRLRIGGGSNTCWPACAVILRYLNGAGTELGNTKFVVHNEFCNWANSDTAHLIEVNPPEQWLSLSVNVAQELSSYLIGVNPADVARIRIELFAYDNGT